MTRVEHPGAAPPPAAAVQPSAADDGTRRAALRRGVYGLLIAIALGSFVGRVCAVTSVDALSIEKYLKSQGRDDWQKQRPFLSSNDRSRWATVRALVEHGTYQIDAIVSQPNWDTIDMVKHDDAGRAAPGPDEGHLYSSKPPLLATLVAIPYALVYHSTGATLGTHPYEIGRGLVVLINGGLLLAYFLSIVRLAERWGATDWGRLFVVAAGLFGTLLTAFAVVLNNHLPGAVAATLALEATLRIVYDGERRARWFLLAGASSAFAVTCELPALAMFAVVAAALTAIAWRPTLLGFVPGALVVAAAFFGTNYAAHGTLVMPYGQRAEGNNWYDYQYRRGDRVIDSYWSKPEKKSPVDQGERDPRTYALHALMGHHGVFSLTPIWLLAWAGLAYSAVARGGTPRAAAAAILLVSVTCLAFYLLRPLEDRNYGGMTSGFRWMFWFAPLWLFGLLPAADGLAGRRWGRCLAGLLLAASVMSAAYPTWNPWTHPWLYNFLEYLGWARLGMG